MDYQADSAGRPPRIMLLTNSEYGQANVQLAVLHELLTKGGTEVHFTSFAELEPRVKEVENRSQLVDGKPVHASFHEIGGSSMLKMFNKSNGRSFETRKPGFFGAWKALGSAPQILLPWTPEDAIRQIQRVGQLIDEIRPDLVICDPLYLLGRDACRWKNQKTVILSPNTVKEHVAHLQGAKALWMWGGVGTAFPYPLPWYLIPLAIIISLRAAIIMGLFLKSSPIAKARKAFGMDWPLAVFDRDAPNELREYIVTTPELDLPAIIPPNIACVGPILQAVEPVKSKDPELADWLSGGPTILIVLGSIFDIQPAYAAELVCALKQIMNVRKDVQVLWKYQSSKASSDVTSDPSLQDLVSGGRLRIVKWLEADPLAVLQTGHICCSVNHGGSNSYHEAMATGTPQVLLPAWFDCYDFAIRTKWLKNGGWGNEKGSYTDTGIIAQEFASTVLDVIGRTATDEAATAMKTRCVEYATVAMSKGGRQRAAAEILQLAYDLTAGDRP